MSTRAIVRVQGVGPASKQDTWNLSCHYDGYWRILGALVNHVIRKAGENDSNVVGGFGTPGRFPNIALATDAFIVYLIQQHGDAGYIGAYMTTRIPEEELATKSTDIEYLYVVSMQGDGTISLESFCPNPETKMFVPCVVSEKEMKLGEECVAILFPE